MNEYIKQHWCFTWLFLHSHIVRRLENIRINGSDLDQRSLQTRKLLMFAIQSLFSSLFEDEAKFPCLWIDRLTHTTFILFSSHVCTQLVSGLDCQPLAFAENIAMSSVFKLVCLKKKKEVTLLGLHVFKYILYVPAATEVCDDQLCHYSLKVPWLCTNIPGVLV